VLPQSFSMLEGAVRTLKVCNLPCVCNRHGFASAQVAPRLIALRRSHIVDASSVSRRKWAEEPGAAADGLASHHTHPTCGSGELSSS
jgi:hypothetical protein